jgi:hypothetical protein
MKSAAAITALLFAFSAHANCVGSGSFQSCTDSSGNNYTVNRLGSSTYVQGSNPNTGSNWSQETYRSGNTSNTYGRDADGNSWNSSTFRNGSSSTTIGTDSNGRAFARTCNQFGCF